ncbi:GGDEF domain-containing protein [Fusibacter ferrireducens]|uniref:Diguanylate cyclase n=1 Tax=Fusibacter ferrireducens TaxID=2785058 RepID=A0ABR9ZUX5_9FIRM|nr:diguanylate cyclase [Fusibacter ferrireducens]MBF4694262.1 diguanylate cyclase [Fusibacter ferrireducens]
MKIKGLFLYIIILVLIVLGASFWMNAHVYNSMAHIPLVNGTSDLSDWQGKQSSLTGLWQFYPNTRYGADLSHLQSQFKQVPHSWEEDAELNFSPYGVGVYKGLLTGLDPSKIYGFFIYDEVTAYNLYINDKQVAKNGNVDRKIPEWRPTVGAFVSDREGRAEIAMEISNDHYYRGGFWNSIEIGFYDEIVQNQQRHRFLSAFVSSSLFAMGVFFLGIFVMYRRRADTMYFALICICMSIYSLLIVERLIHQLTNAISWDLLVRLEYATGYVLLPLFCLFILKLFPTKKLQVLEKSLVLIAIALGIMPMLLDNQMYTLIFAPYKYLSVICIVIISLMLVKAIHDGAKGSYLMLTACAVIAIALIKELGYPNEYSYIPFAGLVVIWCFALIVIERFATTDKRNQLLERRIELDELTGLRNRAYILSSIERYTESIQAAGAYLLFLDLDGFKSINDTYGHHVGDKVLIMVSRGLQVALDQDDVIARFGGDEFLILAQRKDQAEIEALADKLIHVVGEVVLVGELDLTVGISIGISPYIKGDLPKEWIARSDQAMYLSKRGGSNRYTILTHK